MPARLKSACRLAASSTGVVSAKVTIRTFGVLSILQLHHRGGVVQSGAGHLARDFTVVGPSRIEQQQRVSGRCGVHDHKLAACLEEYVAEGLEDRDFFGTGGAQILFE